MRRFLAVLFILPLVAAMALTVSCDSSTDSDQDSSNKQNPPGAPGAIPWNGSVSYGSLDYGGQTYKTVKIGTQTWMAENLNFKVDSSWCYENSPDSCAKYGRLYQWAAAMGLDASYEFKHWGGVLPRRGICPEGWHVPSDAEWTTLTDFIGGAATAGTKLRSISGWKGLGDSPDTYGFRDLPAGRRYTDGSFHSFGSYSCFWTSTENDPEDAWFRDLNSVIVSLRRDYFFRTHAHSVRCLKDSP
jgi:uncharacterized protein (TIGR02145 family)